VSAVVRRRTVLRACLAAGLLPGAAAHAAGCSRPRRAEESPTTPNASTAATPHPASPGPTLRPAAAPAPYAGQLADTLRRYLKPTPENPRHPSYAGAVALVATGGEVVVHEVVGDALRYGNGPVELAPARRVAMRPDSIFDLASITKVFTALAVLQQVERGRLALDAPVADYLREFRGDGKAAVTVAQLLTHTSGLPVGVSLAGVTGRTAQRRAILTTPLVRGSTPGSVFRYSGLGLLVAGLLLEQVTGQSLDVVVRDGLTTPLGLRDTGFRPRDWLTPADAQARLVATDARANVRGLLRGAVHDSIANAVGGVAGHAGMFGSARDLAVLGQALLNGGEYGGSRLLTKATVEQMLVDRTAGLPVVDDYHPDRPPSHGLGVDLDQPWYMGRLASARTFGHTGFTGTSLVVDPARNLVVVLLTSRAHPDWNWANPDPVRVAVANLIADRA
jgi:CubicO group peptidase (beta-lactamase class C family)